MKVAKLQLLLLIAQVLRHFSAAAYEIADSQAVWHDLTAAAHNISRRKLCQHQWRGSKLIGCGNMGCAFDVYSEAGVRGVKKVYYPNASSSTKYGEDLPYPQMHRCRKNS